MLSDNFSRMREAIVCKFSGVLAKGLKPRRASTCSASRRLRPRMTLPNCSNFEKTARTSRRSASERFSDRRGQRRRCGLYL